MDEVRYHVGIQVNLSPLNEPLTGKENLDRLKYLTNNLGDCYEEHACPLPNTMDAERASVELFASWLHLAKENCWGYIGGGSSLGNLQGMWIGKTLYPRATLILSKSAHYSVYKFANLIGFHKIKVVDTLEAGEMDIFDFSQKICKEKEVVVVFTSGTTMTSAYDPIKDCVRLLRENCKKYYVHLDAALGGAITPFIGIDELQHAPDDFSFKNPDVSSITVSVHKIIGSPMPANIFIARKNIVDDFKCKVTSIPYLSDIKDITVYGSRDGFRASVVHSRLLFLGKDALREMVKKSIINCIYLLNELKAIGLTSAFRSPGGLAVVIPLVQMKEKISKKNLEYIEGKYHLIKDRIYCHIYVMEHVDIILCDEIICDFKKSMVAKVSPVAISERS